MTKLRIEDYGFIGDTRTAALVGKNGSIDWLCLPRFDGDACFSALLGAGEHGHWQISPEGQPVAVSRSYLGDSLVLETVFELPHGAVAVTDLMPLPDETRHGVDTIRIVRGLRGRVPMGMDLVVRFDYGVTTPWVRAVNGRLHFAAGSHALDFGSPVPLIESALGHNATFVVSKGDSLAFTLTWHEPHLNCPEPPDPATALANTLAAWENWAAASPLADPLRELTMRSLVTLKGLTYSPTGGIVAAPTTSLPEALGGTRNWDYRYCWLRDATFVLYALILGGYTAEAHAWRAWLSRALMGHPADLQIMYGVAGERRLPERELPWLPGYEESRPVRVGNAAYRQFQLDVVGEVMDVFHVAHRAGIARDAEAWRLQRGIIEYLEQVWDQKDRGIWEPRGDRQHFTHSKVMAWVAFDRAVKAVERSGLEGPIDRWRRLRAQVHDEVCARGFDPALGSFVQAYGSQRLDASSLLIALVGFLPAADARIGGTIDAIQRTLMRDGFVYRYAPETPADALPAGEGAFVACSFWLADNLVLSGRQPEAERLFQRLLAIRNDLGLLAEEYDPRQQRQLGNFPQAFSHVGLINSAHNLFAVRGPAHERSDSDER